MPDFRFVNESCAELFARYYSRCNYRSCEYSVGTKCFWYRFYHYEYCIVSDCLVIKYDSEGITVFDYPVPGPDGKIEDSLDFIDSYCSENEIKPVFSDVPSECIKILTDRYSHIKFDSTRSSQDYIYRLEDLRDFGGRHYSGQRNHINQFKRLYPDYTFRKLNEDDDLSSFFDEYSKEYGEMDESGLEEFEVAKAMASSIGCQGIFGGCIEADNKIIAFSIGEITGDTIIIHIEKGLYSYKGVYPVLVSEFLKCFASGNICYVNREEDDGEKGLRTSKLQYRPCFFAKKIVASITCELEDICSYPEIKTQRLKLSRLEDSDNAEYNRLCLDDANNKYWGYDYRKDLDGNPSETWFLDVTRADFDNHICINLGINLDGRLIGEVVAYNPDYKGSIEIGCRIMPEYQNHGYGKEAMTAFSDWILYNLDLQSVKAKCFIQNESSFAMLSSFMTKQGKDGKFFYFIKQI